MTGANPRDHDRHPGHVPATESTDSAGQTWHDRVLTSTGFDADTGEADEAFLAILRDRRAGRCGDVALMAAVPTARLLVPVTAVATETTEGAHGLVEASVDMAVVTLTAPTGERAQPVFTSLAALGAWDPQARPVPVTAARAAQAAVTDGCDLLVLDPGTDREVELRPSMLWALAQERDWLPAHDDPFVAAAVRRALQDESEVVGHVLADAAPAGHGILRVELQLRPGLAAGQVQELATRVGERLALDGETRARIDGLAFAVCSADDPPR